jgi:hypothetical protein
MPAKMRLCFLEITFTGGYMDKKLKSYDDTLNAGHDLHAATFLGRCLRCNCLSAISQDPILQESDESAFEYCLVCGWMGGEDWQCGLPHYNFAFCDPDLICDHQWANLSDDLGPLNTSDLSETEAWIKEYEKVGLEFAYFVLVDVKGEVHWLRGNTEIWGAR